MRRRVAQLGLTVLTAAVVTSLYAFHANRIASSAYRLSEPSRALSATLFIVTLLATAYILGLPDAVRRTRRAVTASFVAPAATVAAVSLVQLTIGDAFLPRFVVFGSLLILPLTNLAISVPLVINGQRTGVRTLMLIHSDQRADLEATMARVHPHQLIVAHTIVADRSFDPAELEPEALASAAGGPIELIAVSDDLLRLPGVSARLSALHAGGVRIRPLLDFYEEWFRLVPLSELEDVSLLFDISELHSPVYVRMKRIIDVACALALLGGFVVAFPFVIIGNAVGNRGSLFFRQPRVGKGGVVFDIWKLRTMNTGSSGGDRWTQNNDPRVTSFGRWLRRLHIDELPQAVNILRGELSMVGPRPEQPQYVEKLRDSIPFYDSRHIVRPGLTGWAQIALGYTSDKAGAQQKLQYELYYIRNQSVSFDIRILIQTVRTSLRQGGR